MSKWLLIIIGSMIILGGTILVLRGDEDSWIKDDRGVYLKHGAPSSKPDEVTQQEALIAKAQEIYQTLKSSGQDLSNGPCLGSIGDDWVADIAHNPRQDVDNLPENQCAAYREGKAHHFIELDLDGNVIKVY